jgi:hypothetical protein
MEEGTEALRRGCALGSSGNVEVTVRPKFRRPDWGGTASGRFAADIITESGGTVTENFGAIVQATDFFPYDANQLPESGYGKSKDVVDRAGQSACRMGAPV